MPSASSRAAIAPTERKFVQLTKTADASAWSNRADQVVDLFERHFRQRVIGIDAQIVAPHHAMPVLLQESDRPHVHFVDVGRRERHRARTYRPEGGKRRGGGRRDRNTRSPVPHPDDERLVERGPVQERRAGAAETQDVDGSAGDQPGRLLELGRTHHGVDRVDRNLPHLQSGGVNRDAGCRHRPHLALHDDAGVQVDESDPGERAEAVPHELGPAIHEYSRVGAWRTARWRGHRAEMVLERCPSRG